MDMQNVKDLAIPEGDVRTIHDKNRRLLWGRLAYDTKYAGDIVQDGTPSLDTPVPVQVVTGEQTVNVHGKNLFNPADYDGLTFNADGSINTTKYYAACSPVTLKLKPNTRYTLTERNPQGQVARNNIDFSVNGAWININSGIQYINTGADGTIVLRAGAPAYPSIGKAAGYIQLEESLTYTSYEPYIGHDYTVALGSIELAKIGTYQDYIHKSGNDWYVYKAFAKLELDGSENWMVANTTSLRYPFGTDISGVPGELKGAAISDTYIYDIASGEATGADANKFTFRGRWAGDRFYFMTPKAAAPGSTAEEIVSSFKTFLSVHPTKVYFTPMTATDTKITDATLISQLNAIHQWLTRYGYNATVSGNLPLIVDRTNL